MDSRQLLAVIAERIRKDKLAQLSFVDEDARRLAHVTLDSLAMNIAMEIEGRDKRNADLADSFLKACGPRYREVK